MFVCVNHGENIVRLTPSPPLFAGALPPELSLVVLGREGTDDYLFSILTGYFDPPEGVEIREGTAYNPYFPGGVLGMPQQLFLDSVEYEDGKNVTHTPLVVYTILYFSAAIL